LGVKAAELLEKSDQRRHSGVKAAELREKIDQRRYLGVKAAELLEKIDQRLPRSRLGAQPCTLLNTRLNVSMLLNPAR